MIDYSQFNTAMEPNRITRLMRDFEAYSDKHDPLQKCGLIDADEVRRLTAKFAPKQRPTARQPPPPTPELTEIRRKIRMTVRAYGPVSARAIRAEFPDNSERTLRNIISAMVARGEIVRVGPRKLSMYTMPKEARS